MSKQVTVNFFDIDWDKKTPNLVNTLDTYSTLTLDKRWRGDIRLEDVKKRSAEPERKLPERYLLDFSKKRIVGPGQLSNTTPIEGIQMTNGQSFGEETAALYVPSKKWLLVLHNQFGIGSSRISEYFNALDDIGGQQLMYSADVKLDPKILARFGSMTHLVKFEVSATAKALDATNDLVGVAVARATQPTGSQKISIKLSANTSRKKVNFLNKSVIDNFVSKLRGQIDEVSVMKVKGADPTADGQDKVIDLLQHKLKRQFPTSELVISHNRYTTDSRWNMLERALVGWI